MSRRPTDLCLLHHRSPHLRQDCRLGLRHLKRDTVDLNLSSRPGSMVLASSHPLRPRAHHHLDLLLLDLDPQQVLLALLLRYHLGFSNQDMEVAGESAAVSFRLSVDQKSYFRRCVEPAMASGIRVYDPRSVSVAA